MLLAALAGLVVSFLVFAVLMIVTPDADLHAGEGDVVWSRFQFEEPVYVFTEGSVAHVVNEDGVPLNLFVTGPGGDNVSFALPANGSAEVDLQQMGTYRLQADVYPWGVTEIEVRSANPVVRFFEDLF